MIKKLLCVVCLFISFTVMGQNIVSNNKEIEKAFNLALHTVDDNVKNGILTAGADYGGEWTRDISINSWNGASLLWPKVAEQSLWSVTVNKDTIGHQYWDKILWVTAAYNHYKITGNKAFLAQAYTCAANTMKELEQIAYDKKYQLFTGPSVFNDGIAGYPEPIFEPGNNSSYVLDHKATAKIKCLSTNCSYYGAYLTLQQMSIAINKIDAVSVLYQQKANSLKGAILKNFYDSKTKTLKYLIDQNGKADRSQEGLGISFAVIFGVLDGTKASDLIKNAAVSKFGITSIYPDFKRYSADTPGRHNNIVWPMVNGFFSQAAVRTGNYKIFTNELMNLTHLALDADKGNMDFKEIYNPYSGKPDGGWQANGAISNYHWTSCKAQTWSATAYISMVINGLVGLKANADNISFQPFLPSGVDHIELNDLTYRNAILNITVKGNGSKIKKITIDGKAVKTYSVSKNVRGVHNIVIEMIES